MDERVLILAPQGRDADVISRLLAAAGMGTWDLDVGTGALSASAACKQIFGRAAKDDFTYDDLLAAIHPDDREQQETAVRRALKTHHDFDIEYRIAWPDGRTHWV